VTARADLIDLYIDSSRRPVIGLAQRYLDRMLVILATLRPCPDTDTLTAAREQIAEITEEKIEELREIARASASFACPLASTEEPLGEVGGSALRASRTGSPLARNAASSARASAASAWLRNGDRRAKAVL
jgi:hypothetical protein